MLEMGEQAQQSDETANLWSGFTRDPGAGTVVVNQNGVIEYINPQRAHWPHPP